MIHIIHAVLLQVLGVQIFDNCVNFGQNMKNVKLIIFIKQC